MFLNFLEPARIVQCFKFLNLSAALETQQRVKMSKLSFRARQLDSNKALPVYRAEELPDLTEFSTINRAVPQMPTGMEKEEETVSKISCQLVVLCSFLLEIMACVTSNYNFQPHNNPTISLEIETFVSIIFGRLIEFTSFVKCTSSLFT